MAGDTVYFVAEYDTLAGGSFTEEGADLTWPGSSGFIITDVAGAVSTEGKLHVALLTGSIPTSGQTLTQGGVTASCTGPASNGDAASLLYPAYAREDLAVAAAGPLSWTGPALGATHSFFFSGQTSNVVAGEILTFTDGQQCEVVTVESDAGATGELSVRWITDIDTGQFPDDADTFTGSIAGDGALDGVVHPRCYSPLNLHRFLQDLADDRRINSGSDDIMAVYKPTPSRRNTDQIVQLRGTYVINDTIAQHMFGGSVEQLDGDTLYSGLALAITDDGTSEPVVIQDDGVVTEYWGNAFMADSIAGRVRVVIKTRDDGVDIDGKRIKAKLLEFGDTYFEGNTTLGVGETGLAVFSSQDGNNQTAVGTVAGAPYNTIVQTEGFQNIDYNNGSGSRPYAYELGLGSASKGQAYERTKYIQRRGTAETLFGRNAQLFTGITINWAYDAESGNFTEPEEVAWGNQVPYTLSVTPAAQVWQVDDSGPTFVDQTTGFNDATGANFTPFPATEAVADYVAIGLDQPFARISFDAAGGTAGVGGVVVWEYWDGSAWSALSGVTDGTTGFTAGATDGQVLTFTLPSDWKKNTLNAVEAYYIRARITTVYSTNPVYDQGFITGDGFTVGEVIATLDDASRGRVLMHDTTNDILIVAQDSGATAFGNTTDFAGLSSGAVARTGSVVSNANSGTMQLYALDDQGTTGNMYGQRTRGTAPVDNQLVYGATSLQTAAVDGTPQTRVVNIQYFGVFTGADFNPANFGMALDPANAGASDLFTDLLGANQSPPNNQSGVITSGAAGDYLAVYPWDGATTDINGDPDPDFDEAQLSVALSAGVSTIVNVGTSGIPINTPAAGFLRVQRDSDLEYDLVEYSSQDGDDEYTLVGTAPSAAAIGRNVMRAFIDRVWATTGVNESYTAVQTGSNQVVITLRRGGVGPIVTFKGNATFGATGFTAAVQRISDA